MRSHYKLLQSLVNWPDKEAIKKYQNCNIFLLHEKAFPKNSEMELKIEFQNRQNQVGSCLLRLDYSTNRPGFKKLSVPTAFYNKPQKNKFALIILKVQFPPAYVMMLIASASSFF